MPETDIKHEFYLDYNSFPIWLNKDREYAVLETRVVRREDLIFFRHLVSEIGYAPL